MTAFVARLLGTVELSSLGADAVNEYLRRRTAAQRMMQAGEKTAQQATALLLPWLRAAVALGAHHLPELRDQFEDLGTDHARRAACALVADQLCPRPAMIAAIHAGMLGAVKRHEAERTPTRETRARTLIALNAHFGGPPMPYERIAA